MKISVRGCLKRNSMLVWVKKYISKNFATCKSLCDLHELYTAFKEKHPNINIEFSKFCTLRPKWCVLAGLKMTHSVCVCSAFQNVVWLVDAMDCDLTYKDRIKKILCNPDINKCTVHRFESCPGTATLKEFLDQELNEHEDDDKFNYCQWDNTDQAILTTITATYKEYKGTLIDVIDDLTRHLYHKAKNYQFLIQNEIQSYHWSKGTDKVTSLGCMVLGTRW